MFADSRFVDCERHIRSSRSVNQGLEGTRESDGTAASRRCPAAVPATDGIDRGGAAEVSVRRGAVGIPGRRGARSTMQPSNRCADDLYDDEGPALIHGM